MDSQPIRKKNCLTLIKLIAAFQVMIGHIREHLELPFPKWLGRVLGFYDGVPVFFIVSGFLIWLSMERSSSYSGYLKKRFWRIYPELWVAVIIEIVTIIFFYSGWNIRDLSIFTFTQGSVFQFWTPNSLRGYGCGTPNGTLWTMCVTIQFYIIAWLIRNLLHKKSQLVWGMGFIVLVGVSLAGQMIVGKIGKEIIIKLYGQTILKYCWLFYIGCFIAEFKEKLLPVLSKYWLLLLIIGAILYLTHFDLFAGYWVFWPLLLGSGLVGFAYAFPQLSIKTDISYGIFLYHMIIVNIFIQIGWMQNWGYALIVMMITVLLAYVSTKTIGAWSAKRKILKLTT